MGAITLSTGETVTIDVSSMTNREWREFVTGKATVEKDDEIVSRCSGIPVGRLTDDTFLRDDYRRLVRAIVKTAQEPLADPNSPSASTSG